MRRRGVKIRSSPRHQLPRKMDDRICVVCKEKFNRTRHPITKQWLPRRTLLAKLTCSPKCFEAGKVCARCKQRRSILHIGAYLVCRMCRTSLRGLYKQCPGCRKFKHRRLYGLRKGKLASMCRECSSDVLRATKGVQPRTATLLRRKKIVLPAEIFDSHLPDIGDALFEARARMPKPLSKTFSGDL